MGGGLGSLPAPMLLEGGQVGAAGEGEERGTRQQALAAAATAAAAGATAAVAAASAAFRIAARGGGEPAWLDGCAEGP
jgi:hypothetical protein